MGTARTPSLADVLDHALAARQREIHTAIVAKVVAYDHASQTVDVQPVVTRVFVDPDGTEISERYPQIPSVPVAFPQAGGFFLTFPIQAGDHVLLVFMERPIDQWRAKGTETDPADLRTHGTGSAIAIPGVVPTSKALASADASVMLMGCDTGAQLGIDSVAVNIGEKSAAAFIARADKADARFSAIESNLALTYALLLSHVHPVTAIGSPTGPAPTLAALSAPSGSSTAASKGKVT